MAYLAYRNFDGADNKVCPTCGDLGGESAAVITVAWCLRFNTVGQDCAYFNCEGDNPVDLYDSSDAGGRAQWYVQATAAFVAGPALSPAHDCVIVVMATDGTDPVDWSYYRFDTETWTHTTTGSTVAAPGTFTVGEALRFGSSMEADMVCGGAWLSKLSEAEREELSVDFDSWIALAPTELWRFDETDPADSVIGSAVQHGVSTSDLGDLNGDSPLLETATPPEPPSEESDGTYCGSISRQGIRIGSANPDLYFGSAQKWSAPA